MKLSKYIKEIGMTLKIKYSFPKFQWLAGTATLVSLLYLSSEEIWTTVDAKPFPEVSLERFVCYLVFFLAILVGIHYFDTKRVVKNNATAIAASLMSIVFDVCLISMFEFVVLFTLQVLPQDILSGIMVLLIGALPSSIGAIALSSLSTDVLKKRAEELNKEVKEITKQAESLKKQIQESKERLKDFETKKKEFEEAFEKKASE